MPSVCISLKEPFAILDRLKNFVKQLKNMKNSLAFGLNLLEGEFDLFSLCFGAFF